MLNLLVGKGTCGAAEHRIAHYVDVLSLEEAEERCALHFVLCGSRKREIRWCGRLLRQAQVKWVRLR